MENWLKYNNGSDTNDRYKAILLPQAPGGPSK